MKRFIKSLKNYAVISVYNIGRFLYRQLALSRFPLVQKLAIKCLSYFLTQQYKLCFSTAEFLHNEDNINNAQWVTVQNVSVIGGSRLLTRNQSAYIPSLQNHGLWDQLRRFKLQEEAQVIFRINCNDKIVRLKPITSSHLIEGICFSALSPFSSSWVHWLFEMFPQLLQLSQRLDKDTIKILVEPNAPVQIYETITAFFPSENIVKVKSRDQVLCQNLLIFNNPERSWSVLWGRDPNEKLVETYQHDIEALKNIRQAVYQKFSILDVEPTEKIFIRRNANFRFIHNEQELADALFAKNFTVIEPSIMSFQQQVECFSKTKIIVAQAGASLANIIFMQPGSTVICMAADSPFLNYEYFLSIAQALGISFQYILGPVDDERKYSHKLHLSVNHPLNASFTINKSELEKALLSFQ